MTLEFSADTVHDLAPHDLVGEDRVAGRMYTDPRLFEREMTAIFERTWV